MKSREKKTNASETLGLSRIKLILWTRLLHDFRVNFDLDWLNHNIYSSTKYKTIPFHVVSTSDRIISNDIFLQFSSSWLTKRKSTEKRQNLSKLVGTTQQLVSFTGILSLELCTEIYMRCFIIPVSYVLFSFTTHNWRDEIHTQIACKCLK